jgi:glucosamine-6-phosphate deaminase
MKTIVVKDKEEGSRRAADLIMDQVRRKSDSVLALPTGSTPLALYRILTEHQLSGKIDFGKLRSFNLDEFVDLPREHPASFHAYMKGHFPARSEFPDPANPEEYERRIDAAGGIDLAILGIGRNGHIGFNEPGSARESRTRVVKLEKSTRLALLPQFGTLSKVPKKAVTMGIQTILKSRKILVLVFGKEKLPALVTATQGAMTVQCPASFLQDHSDFHLLTDLKL